MNLAHYSKSAVIALKINLTIGWRVTIEDEGLLPACDEMKSNSTIEMTKPKITTICHRISKEGPVTHTNIGYQTHGEDSICVDLIFDMVLVQSICRPIHLVNINDTSQTQFKGFEIETKNLYSGEYILIGRLRLVTLTLKTINDMRRLILHDHCIAKVEIFSPRNGHVVPNKFQVIPKIIQSNEIPIHLPDTAIVCLAVNGEKSCTTQSSFQVQIDSSVSSVRMQLTVENQGHLIATICSDLVEVHIASVAPLSWPYVLTTSGLVAVNPRSQRFVLSSDISHAFSQAIDQAVPTRVDENYTSPRHSVAIVDSWNGVIDWKRYVSREWSELLEELTTAFGYSILSPSQLLSAFQRNIQYDCILYFEAPSVHEWKEIQRHISHQSCQFLFCDDLHNCNMKGSNHSFLKSLFKSIDGFISPYGYIASSMIHPRYLSGKDIFWLPHSACSFFSFTAIHPKPVERILLLGAVNKKFYPLRVWAMEMVSSLPVDVHLHPGYEGFKTEADAATQVNLTAILMHSYLAIFTDTSRLNYLVAKIFEIPATGSLLLLNNDAKQYLTRLGFIDGQHYLSYDPQDPIPTMNYVMDPANRPHVDRMRQAGQKLVLSDHLISHRAMELSHIIEHHLAKWSIKNFSSTLCQHGYIGETRETCLEQYSLIHSEACCS